MLAYFDDNHPQVKMGFSQYRNFFNVHRIWFPEPLKFEQVPEFYKVSQGVRDTLFSPCNDELHGWVTMNYLRTTVNGANAQTEKE